VGARRNLSACRAPTRWQLAVLDARDDDALVDRIGRGGCGGLRSRCGSGVGSGDLTTTSTLCGRTRRGRRRRNVRVRTRLFHLGGRDVRAGSGVGVGASSGRCVSLVPGVIRRDLATGGRRRGRRRRLSRGSDGRRRVVGRHGGQVRRSHENGVSTAEHDPALRAVGQGDLDGRTVTGDTSRRVDTVDAVSVHAGVESVLRSLSLCERDAVHLVGTFELAVQALSLVGEAVAVDERLPVVRVVVKAHLVGVRREQVTVLAAHHQDGVAVGVLVTGLDGLVDLRGELGIDLGTSSTVHRHLSELRRAVLGHRSGGRGAANDGSGRGQRHLGARRSRRPREDEAENDRDQDEADQSEQGLLTSLSPLGVIHVDLLRVSVGVRRSVRRAVVVGVRDVPGLGVVLSGDAVSDHVGRSCDAESDRDPNHPTERRQP
jgi:hypothetical protein